MTEKEDKGKSKGFFSITIDTEEEGRWGGGYPRQGHTMEHMKNLPVLQKLFDKYNVKPVYLVDYPIVKDVRSKEILKEIHDDGRCEIGGHVHPWCNPPFEEKTDTWHSFMCNLPPDLQKEKIRILTEEIGVAFDVKPRSFRAGRYGCDHETCNILESLGYVVDSSVTPFKTWEDGGGPNFMDSPFRPYFPHTENINVEGKKRLLLEAPVSVGFNWKDFDKAHSFFEYCSDSFFCKKTHLIGIMDRLSVLKKIFLTPEIFSKQELILLSKVYAQRKVPLQVLMFHSSSILPGQSPYVKDEKDREVFYDKLEGYIQFATGELKLKNCTLTGFRNNYIGETH